MIQALQIEDQIEIKNKLIEIEKCANQIDIYGDKLKAIGVEIETYRKRIDMFTEEIKEKLGLNEPEIAEIDLPF